MTHGGKEGNKNQKSRKKKIKSRKGSERKEKIPIGGNRKSEILPHALGELDCGQAVTETGRQSQDEIGQGKECSKKKMGENPREKKKKQGLEWGESGKRGSNSEKPRKRRTVGKNILVGEATKTKDHEKGSGTPLRKRYGNRIPEKTRRTYTPRNRRERKRNAIRKRRKGLAGPESKKKGCKKQKGS